MTLVITELSSFGIVMIADSAMTVRSGSRTEVRSGVAKVHYADAPNVGLAVWGNACVGKTMIDSWLATFTKHLTDRVPVEQVANRVASELNAELARTGKPWASLRGGIHVAGYEGELPRLYHVHTGPEEDEQHELRVFQEFPESGKNPFQYSNDLRVGIFQLRSGYHKSYAPLFAGMVEYIAGLHRLGYDWPHRELGDRYSFYCLQIRFLADTLLAAGRHPGVDANVSGIGISAKGLVLDHRLPACSHDVCGSFDHGEL